jgi:chloramphenicol-sensitive protein RarD
MDPRSGVFFALAAFTSWGLLPVYWKLLARIPAPELLMHRLLWTSLFAAFLVTVTSRGAEVRAILRSPRYLLALTASSLLLAGNWLTFIWAVNRGEIVATSLGYYLNPIVSVALGVLVLREKLRPLQLFAVGLAATGVVAFSVMRGELPWIALVLASSFALYGLIRKTVPVASIAGIAVETGLVAPFAALAIAWREGHGTGAFANAAALHGHEPVLLVASGVVTALPLIWFASATRRLRLATVGILQYIAPSIALAIAVLFYGEPFTRAHAVAFACIWAALALYSLETWRASRSIDLPLN